MHRIARAAVAVAALAAFGAQPAAALESLTGIYQGTLKCRGLLGGTRVKGKVDVEVDVSDVGGVLLLSVGELGSFEGFAVTDVKKPDRGTVSAVSCPLSVGTLDGAMLNADVRIPAGKETGTLEGTLFLSSDEQGDARRCELQVKRISVASPMIITCPKPGLP
jgi:hypothetical protein